MQNVLACLVMIHYPSWLNKVYLSQYWTKKLLSSRWWLLQAEKNLSVKVKGLALLSYWLTESGQDSGFWLCEALEAGFILLAIKWKDIYGVCWVQLIRSVVVYWFLVIYLVFNNILEWCEHWMMWTPGCPALLVLLPQYVTHSLC